MTSASAAGAISLSALAFTLALLSTLSAPAFASTPPPTEGPITVVVPPSASPSPSPSNNGGGGGGSTGGSGVTPDDDGAASCTATNSDGSPTPAASPSDDARDLEVDRERLVAGEWLIVRSSDFTRGERAQVVMYPGAIVIGSFTVDAPTGFAARFKLPEGILVGTYQLEATGWASCTVANNQVTVVSGPVPVPAPIIWWPYVVFGSMGVGLVSLLIAFRLQIALWFAPAAAPGPVP